MRINALMLALLALGACSRLDQARIDSTRTDARTVKSAAEAWMAEHPDGECPSPTQLIEEDYLDRDRRIQDAWDQELRIECSGDEIAVTSSGPDGQFGNDDDIASE